MRRVRCTSLYWGHCCIITAAAKPGYGVGCGTPNCHVRERVFEEGGATWAAAVATWAWVLMHGVGLVGVEALKSHAAHRLQWHSCLDKLAGKVVGLMLVGWAGLPVGLLVVGMGDALVGLPAGILVGTLIIGDCSCMERMICLLSLICGLGVLGGACSLGTCCLLWLFSGIMVSSNLLGFACKWACVASTIHCRSYAAWEFLALPVIPWMALTQESVCEY